MSARRRREHRALVRERKAKEITRRAAQRVGMSRRAVGRLYLNDRFVGWAVRPKIASAGEPA